MEALQALLSDIKPGECGMIMEIDPNCSIYQRLTDIGLTKGTNVECLQINTGQSLIALSVRGAQIALRREDLKGIRYLPSEHAKLPGEKLNKKRNNSPNSHSPIIALAGNPNVGKSTVFNTLTGGRQHTGNWPGKTVASARGTYTYHGVRYELVDLPGSYSLHAQSAEEEVTRDFIRNGSPDAVLVVCDATCLERNLILLLQILDIQQKAILCVNLLDEAEKKGIRLDLKLLSERLHIPVIGTAARSKRGLHELKDAVAHTVKANDTGCTPDCALPVSDGQTIAEKAHQLCLDVVTYTDPDYDKHTRRADQILTSRRLGFPLMFVLLLTVFWLTIVGANYPSKLLARVLFGLEPPLAHGIFYLCDRLFTAYRALLQTIGFAAPSEESLIHAVQTVTDLLAHGAYRTLAWIVSVMLPPMAIFFPLFTLLEDSGYLPRIAFNMDYCFQKCHACGKQCLTMCMGFGCNAAGVIGCRIIDSPRERLIAVLTNAFVPCNGRFPTLTALISMFLLTGTTGVLSSFRAAFLLTAVILLGILATLLVSRLLSATVLKGMPSSFLLELPPYRRPQIGKVIVRSIYDRTLFVLGRAVLAALPAGILLWLFSNLTVKGTTLLSLFADVLNPFASLLGLDGFLLLAFLLGFPANEIVIPILLMGYLSTGALTEYESLEGLRAILTANGWTAKTAVCTMLFMLFHFPCSTTCITIYKETNSLRYTALAFLLPTVTGIVLCMLVNLVWR